MEFSELSKYRSGRGLDEGKVMVTVVFHDPEYGQSFTEGYLRVHHAPRPENRGESCVHVHRVGGGYRPIRGSTVIKVRKEIQKTWKMGVRL